MSGQVPIDEEETGSKALPMDHTATLDAEKAFNREDGTDTPTSPACDIDPAAERRLRWKLDYTIYPILCVTYMFSFLDRINIGNAKIQGMMTDLDLTGNRYNVALFVYFISYILFEIPSNMIIRKVRPSIWLSSLMLCWGIINMSMGWVKTYQGLVVLRFFLGMFEAGYLPGMLYLTSVYYKRHEFQIRTSFLYSCTLMAGAFGGLLAYAIANLGGQRGYAAWQWIFIIEGAVTAGLALLGYIFIVDFPEDCRFLNAEEKELLQRRIAADGGDRCRMDTLNGFAYRLIFTDPKVWLGAFMYMGIGTTGYATSFFMPTILLEFGWSAQMAQVHTIPVYVVACAGMMITAYISDRLKQRYVFIFTGTLIATVGYGMLLAEIHLTREAKYAAMFLVTLGCYVAQPIPLAWIPNNVSGHWKRAFASGMQLTIGSISGLIGSNIFLLSESPTYKTGYGTALGMFWFGNLCALTMYLWMRNENRQRDAGARNDRLDQPKEEVDNMGDYHPSFRFTL